MLALVMMVEDVAISDEFLEFFFKFSQYSNKDRIVPFTDQETEAQRSQNRSLDVTELVNADTELNCNFDFHVFLSLRQKCTRDFAEFKVCQKLLITSGYINFWTYI